MPTQPTFDNPCMPTAQCSKEIDNMYVKVCFCFLNFNLNSEQDYSKEWIFRKLLYVPIFQSQKLTSYKLISFIWCFFWCHRNFCLINSVYGRNFCDTRKKEDELNYVMICIKF